MKSPIIVCSTDRCCCCRRSLRPAVRGGHACPGNQAVRNVHLSLYGKEPFQIRVGGSIPVCGLFQKYLNAYTINFGFGLNDERMHSPNEFFRLSSFERGQKGYCMLLHELGATNLG